MRAARVAGNAALAVWLVLALAVARIAPSALLLVFIGVPYRVAGALVAIPAVVLLVHAAVAARSAVLDRAPLASAPDDEYVRAVVQAARSRGVPVPTVVLAGDGDGRSAPVAIRGWRWCFVVIPPGSDPLQVIEAVGEDLRDGTARLRPLLWAVSLAVTDWRTSLRMLTAPFRRSLRTDVRWYLLPLVVLLPGVVVGQVIAWAVGTVTGWLLPRRLRTTAPPRSARADIEPGTVDPSVPQVAPSSPALRRIPPLREVEDLISPMARIIVALLVTFLAAYQGPGVLPGERIAWPWERGPEHLEVVDVHHTPRSDGLLGHLGVQHNSTWQPTIDLGDGTEQLLPEGTTEVQEGATIPVVSWQDDAAERYRHLEQTSMTRYVVMSLVMLGVAWGLSRPFASSHRALIGLLGTRRLAQVDFDQRVLSGRRHRRRRPRHLLGNRTFDEV